MKPKKPRLNLPNKVQMPFVKEADTDFSALCSKLEDDVKAGMDDGKRRAYEDCSFVTTSHQRMKSRLLTQLLCFLQKNESKCGDFAQPVVIGNEAVPSFFSIFAVATHKHYNKTSGISETSKYKAL